VKRYLAAAYYFTGALALAYTAGECVVAGIRVLRDTWDRAVAEEVAKTEKAPDGIPETG